MTMKTRRRSSPMHQFVLDIVSCLHSLSCFLLARALSFVGLARFLPLSLSFSLVARGSCPRRPRPHQYLSLDWHPRGEYLSAAGAGILLLQRNTWKESRIQTQHTDEVKRRKEEEEGDEQERGWMMIVMARKKQKKREEEGGGRGKERGAC